MGIVHTQKGLPLDQRFAALAASVVCGFLMFRIIDPKLKAMSVAFEKAQAGHLERMQRRTRWEEGPGEEVPS